MEFLRIRKVADKEGQTRVPMFDEFTGEKKLVNPETPGTEHEPWPLKGYEFDHDGAIPSPIRIGTRYVRQAATEGWIEIEGDRVEHAPGGPDDDPWRVTHTFPQADYIVFNMLSGWHRYKVVQQPGKYDDDSEPSGKRVDWFYELELEASQNG